MNQQKAPQNGYKTRMRTGILRVLCWEGAWLAATALMKFGPKYLWEQASVLTEVAIGLDVVIGAGMIIATTMHIAGLDELQQKVYLNALGITVGVALITGVPFSVMGDYHVIPFHAEIWHLLLLMSVTFMGSFFYGNWRYR